MLKDLVVQSRTCRRFRQEIPIAREALIDLVDLARLSPSGGNLQPLKYYLSCDAKTNAVIFQHVAWAAYLKDWKGPVEGERPAAYIIQLGDTRICKGFDCDQGIAAQSIMLGAREQGLGGCMMGSVQRNGLQTALNIAPHFQILLVLALGRPKEVVILERLGEDGSIKYWRDESGVHHVPKRSIADLIVG